MPSSGQPKEKKKPPAHYHEMEEPAHRSRGLESVTLCSLVFIVHLIYIWLKPGADPAQRAKKKEKERKFVRSFFSPTLFTTSLFLCAGVCMFLSWPSSYSAIQIDKANGNRKPKQTSLRQTPSLTLNPPSRSLRPDCELSPLQALDEGLCSAFAPPLSSALPLDFRASPSFTSFPINPTAPKNWFSSACYSRPESPV